MQIGLARLVRLEGIFCAYFGTRRSSSKLGNEMRTSPALMLSHVLSLNLSPMTTR